MSVLKNYKSNRTSLTALSLAIVLFFAVQQTAYSFSLPFKKKKQEKQKIEKPAVQIKAEHNEFIEYSLEDCIEIALKK